MEDDGEYLWRQAIPQDVRDEVEKRIESALRKQLESTREDYDRAREKLDFCSFGDYAKIIRVKSNWPLFEPIFRRSTDFDRHIEALSEFRNSLMHNRPLTEISRRAGELAIVWIQTVVPEEPSTNIDAQVGADAEYAEVLEPHLET